jgi:hypothetical protein
VKWNTRLKSCTGNGTFELSYVTAAESRTAATGTMAKRQSTRALQQRIQPKRDISNTASWSGYSKHGY